MTTRKLTRVNRRDALASLGLFGGAALLGGCRGQASADPVDGGEQRTAIPPQDRAAAAPEDAALPQAAAAAAYTRIDPRQAADTAYRIYPQGGCMYALMGGIVGALAEAVGEPYRSFPLGMMRYGNGGIGHWGSVCGVVNGGAAAIGLVYPERDDIQREKLIRELCVWYETASLPLYKPAAAENGQDVERSTAGSVLCHISVARWCQAAGCEAFSAEKKERCRRLTADGTRKVVQLLNRAADGAVWPAPVTQEVQACLDCHGKQAQADAMGMMRCRSCHTFEGEHP